jgi:two-component system OmpR family response regulator
MQNEPTTPSKKSANVSIVAQKKPTHRILVVDDDPETRQISVAVLVKSNFEVHAAVDGADGWCSLRDKPFDLVITDNKMPRMTGVELIEKLRYIRLSLPVIMATGQVPIVEFERKPWLLPDATLQRPFSTDDLLAAVKKVLGSYDANWNHMEMLLPKYL